MHKETVRIEIVNSDASDEDDEEEDYFCFHYSPVKQPQVATCNPDTENNEVDELEAEEVEPEMQNDGATEPSEKVLTDDTGSDNGITEEESSIPDQGTEDDEMEEEYHRPQRERRAPKLFTYDHLGTPTCHKMSCAHEFRPYIRSQLHTTWPRSFQTSQPYFVYTF